MPIRQLSALLVNQIAAGEVIERPASVVKELVENSLDAGATRIDIRVEEGGTKLVRISDNGAGIEADELTLAIAPHATSKISDPGDLESIGTLGFRGEALASIASVSRLRITSRPTRDGQTAESATMIESAGDDVAPLVPSAGSPGTVIEVRDLFFNTPARRRFLRTPSTEFGHINEVVTRLAMAHPRTGFTLTHNDRKVTDVAATDDHRQRCVELLGKELDEALLDFESAPDTQLNLGDSVVDPHRSSHIEHPTSPSLWGLAGLPTIARATTRFQYVCLNGRFIRDKRVAHAIKEAYRGLIPHDRNPVVVLFITMDPSAVDVNVHPAKSEVRFRDANRMHSLVLNTLRQRLLGSDLTPSATLGAGDSRLAFDLRHGDRDESSANTDSDAQVNNDSLDAFVDYFKRMAPTQKGFVYEQVKREMGAPEDDPLLDQPTPDADTSANVKAQTILQVHKSYVVTQDEDGIVIVDQHALHERVMFEQLKQRVLERNLESQRLLMPAVVEADAGRIDALERCDTLLPRIGVEASPIGPSAIGVQAFPSFLFDRKVEPVEFLGDLLDQVASGDLDVGTATAEEAALHEVLDMMACKAAVKAGDQMSHDELAELLARRGDVERSSNCPHGRPTTLRLSLRDLEKQFGRT